MFPLTDEQLQFLMYALMFNWLLVVLYLYWTGGDDKYLLKWQQRRGR